MTQWAEIPGFSRYQVSDTGRVRAKSYTVVCGRYRGGVRRLPERELSTPDRGDGYRVIQLTADVGGRVNFGVHRLVTLAFLGPCPLGMEVRHLDGNPSNNTLVNLAYGTPKENNADKVRHGTQTRGEQHSSAKLTDAEVLEIRERAVAGETVASIAGRFNVRPRTVGAIVQGAIWKHLPNPVPNRRSTKLTVQSVVEIRDRYAQGESPSELGREFGVDRGQIHRIVTHQAWSHV